MKKIVIRAGVVVVILVIAAVVVAFLSLDSLVKKGVETVGPQLTKVTVRLDSAKLSPFSGAGELDKFFLGNPDGYKTPSAMEVGSVKLGVEIGSVMSDTVVVDTINLQSPQITLEGTLTGNNLSQILDNLKSTNANEQKQPASTTPSGKPAKKFIVKEIVIDGAKVNVNLSGLGQSVAASVPIPDIHLQNIGTAQGGVSAAELSRQILEPIMAAAVKAAAENSGAISKQVKDLGTNMNTKAIGGAINDLLKPKQ